MGRPIESPWSVRWETAWDPPSLWHGDVKFMSCTPHRMEGLLKGTYQLTSDLAHLLQWAAWLDTHPHDPCFQLIPLSDSEVPWKTITYADVSQFESPLQLPDNNLAWRQWLEPEQFGAR